MNAGPKKRGPSVDEHVPEAPNRASDGIARTERRDSLLTAYTSSGTLCLDSVNPWPHAQEMR